MPESVATNAASYTTPWDTIGPTVSQPKREGFGSDLIKRSTEYELKGETDVSYEPGGLRANICIPIQASENDVG